MDEISKWEEEAGYEFIQLSNIMREREGTIIFQFPNMIEIAKENKLYAFQTDSIFKATSEPTYIGWNEFIANPWVISEIAIPVFVIFPLLIFIYSKKYNWSNWSDKLTGKVNSLPQI